MATGKSLKRPVCFDERSGRLLNSHQEFVVTPPAGRSALSVGGAMLLAGQHLDKGLVDARRLRQMYEARLIAVAPGSVLPVERKMRPRAVGPADTAPEQPLGGYARGLSDVASEVPEDMRILMEENSRALDEKPASVPRVVSRKRLSRAA